MTASAVVRPRVFLDVQIGVDPAGRLVIELFNDKAPKTCENFRMLCAPPETTESLSYKLSPFHRIIDEFMVQGGDITSGDGTGGQSIYGGEFEDENIGWREIDTKGLVCMANRGKGTNSSQFFITLAPCQHLNAKHTIFGHVVSGMDVLDRLAKVKVDKNDRPLEGVLISRCGELERRQKKPTVASQAAFGVNVRGKPHASSDRGRKRVNRSPSSDRSSLRSMASSHGYHKHRKQFRTSISPSFPPTSSNRRRSDTAIDETRRGRALTRSPSPSGSKDTSRQSPVQHNHRRERSPSRSKSRGESPSPRLRRQHTRSRSRSRSLQNVYRPAGRQKHRGDEDQFCREYGKRDRRRGRFEDVIGRSGNRNGGLREREQRQGDYGYDDGTGGRLGVGNGDDIGGEVQFKGRGSMKYRERR